MATPTINCTEFRETASDNEANQNNTRPYREAALAAYDAGLCVCPPREDGSKAPETEKKADGKHHWLVDEVEKDPSGNLVSTPTMPSRKRVERWYGRRKGVGCLTGAISGNVELFEFDDPDTNQAFLSLTSECGLGELVARIRAGYEETTPNDGVHWLYRCPQVSGNTKLAQRPKRPEEMRHPNDKVKVLIETRGDGGYAVTAPSSGPVHPTGKPYVLLSGGFDTIATITPEEREELWNLARSFDEMPVQEPHEGTTPYVVETDRPGDVFNQRVNWAKVLKPHGWKFVCERNGISYWRRPGKDCGVSATTNATGRDTLIVFSTSTPFEARPTSYSKFYAYAVLNHEGDLSAAAKDLQAQGYRSSEPSGLNSLNSLISYPDSGKWPRLHPDALYGLAGDFVRAIEPHTEADPAALLVNFLVRFGSLVGRGAHGRVGRAQHFLNEFAVICGETSKARKDTAACEIEYVFQQIDPEWGDTRQGSGLGSGEGLISAVHDDIWGMKNGKPELLNQGVSDKRLFVSESEFASVLKVAAREGNTLSDVVRKAWDNGTLQTMVKNSPLRATNAHISILGHITMTELKRYLTETEIGNGFANRFLWTLARRSKCLPEGGGEPDLSMLVQRLSEAVSFAVAPRELRRDEEARAFWAEVYPALSDGKPGLLGAVTSRAEAHVLRLSVLYAALDECEFVELPHLKAALAVWDYCDTSARHIFGEATGDDVADRILRALRTAPDGLHGTDLHKLFSNNVKASRIDLALTALEHQGRIRRETTKPNDRTVHTWRLSDTNSTNFTNLAAPNSPAVSPLPEEQSHSTLSQDRPSAKAMESKFDTDLTSDEERGVTPEAWDLLVKVDAGNPPLYMTANLARIAGENGIEVNHSTTPNAIIEALRRKEFTNGLDLTKVPEWKSKHAS